ncbi:hypothetical protein ABH935_007041 [Catenulispora sp. GAS73]|uniref:hypothetical protein n=1 Tax=Catenulispora sp. GAS73 TaxID=3156269 RepID=UPI0035145684
MILDANAETTALIRALLADGWTYSGPVRTESQWRSRIHELASPDGRLSVDVAVFPNGRTTARLSAEAVRTGPATAPGWMVDLHEVPLCVALAAVKAATDTGPSPYPAAETVAAELARCGWEQRVDVTERGRLVEREWDSRNLHRFVRWFPADACDVGGWAIGREGPEATQISQHTPAAVITALALTEVCDRAEPRVSPAASGS